MLTFLLPHADIGMVLDNQYQIRYTIKLATEPGFSTDMHELRFVDNGTRALFFTDNTLNAGKKECREAGFGDNRCRVKEGLVRQLDLTRNLEEVSRWSSLEHVTMGENSMLDVRREGQCPDPGNPGGWDYLHPNSLDKFPDDGSILMSARHTSGIYKIAPDGSIVWRLGGVKSDFRADFTFARQHTASIVEHNSTHTKISLFDNGQAIVQDRPTAKWSRSMIVLLQTDVRPMTATLLAEYPHPDGAQAPRVFARGSTQVLPNGNVFTGWVHACQHSEYTAEGKLVMQARMNHLYVPPRVPASLAFGGLKSH